LARRSVQGRELVRLTPVQFSISVSVVVVLLAGAGITGYLFGLKEAARQSQQASLDPPDATQASEHDPARSETPAPVTFYSVLTESREEVTVPAKPQTSSADERKAETEVGQPGGDLSLILQVASYRGRETASNLLENLSAEGYSGTILAADLGERGIWYRVRIGPYKSENEASRILEKLRRERDLKGFIVR
jgi:cell division protein FtsN